MGSRRRGVREGIPNVNYKREQETFMTTMNAVAEAVREAAVAAARAVDRLGVRNGNENEHGEDSGNNENNLGHLERPMTLATFLKVKPPKFKGTLVATDADNWFRAIERSLRAQHVSEGQHVEFATYMLEGEAEHWWQGIQRLLQQDEGDIPWNTFKDEFYKKYFPRAARDAKEMELMQLKQGNTTIAEYARKFDDLCRFSKICQGNPADFEEWKCLKFEGGLREELMNSVVPLEVRNFAELVNKSKLVEECSKKAAIARADRREASRRDLIQNLAPQGRNFKFNGQFDRQNRNQRNGNFLARNNGNYDNNNLGEEEGGQSQQTQDISVCSRCGKDHGNRACRYGTHTCFSCGEYGHISRNCPKRFVRNPARPQQQGRVFTVTAGNTNAYNSSTRGEYHPMVLFVLDNTITSYAHVKF
ncbi:uncharacterized protein LOC130966561 [Arachis stenosperma]|uniref:uncharacterized protein LOC130966561 n=1 Tax=Arachis stenosperma TaxID=217475 RepID=UPI0025AD51BB|nr:uncharacterized protein LOC130966561 [Arachis stenosperma]